MELIRDTNLILHLPLYELDGTNIRDRSAYGRSCTVTGSLWKPEGRYFDGVDDQITITGSSALNLKGSLSVEAWVKLGAAVADQPASNATIFGKQVNSSSTRNYAAYINKAGDTLYFLGRKSNDAGWAFICTLYLVSQYLNDLVWHHLAFVWDRDNTTSYIYTDNITRKITAGGENFDLATGGSLTLGRLTDQDDSYFKGTEGEVRIYNRALSPVEIQRNYLATRWRYQ